MAWIRFRYPCQFLIPLVMAFSSLYITSAEIRQIQITTFTPDDVLVGIFGFTKTYGRLELNVTDVYISNPNPPNNLSMMGFFLTTYKSYPQRDENPFLYPDRFMIIYTFDKLQGNNFFNLVYSQFDYGEQYNLRFVSNYAVNISMNVRYAMYNLVDDGNGNRTRPSYMSASKAYHPFIHGLLFLIYLMLSCFLICLLLIFNKSRAIEIRSIHKFMFLVLLLKTIALLVELFREFYIIHTGYLLCWPTLLLSFISGFFNQLPLVTLRQLVASGWSFIKPSLFRTDKVLLILTMFAEVSITVMNFHVEISTELLGLNDYKGILDAQHVVHIPQLLCVLIAGVLSIKFLHQAGKAHGKASDSSLKVRLLTLFLIIVFIYHEFELILPNFISSHGSTYRYLWRFLLVEELWNLMLYAFIGYTFRPGALNIKPKYNDDVEKVVALLYNNDVDKAVHTASTSTKQTLGPLFIFELAYFTLFE